MRWDRFFTVFLLATFSVVFFVKAGNADDVSSSFQYADQLRKQGKLEESYGLLTELLRDNPDNEQINFSYALTCIERLDFARAQLALERILLINPGNDRAQLELARLYMAMDQYNLAREGFEAVLGNNPPATVRQSINEKIAMLDRSQSSLSWSGRFDLGYISDDNINIGPNSKIINISPIIFSSGTSITSLSVNESSQPLKDDGFMASMAMSFAYDYGLKRKWLAFSDVAYYQNWLNDYPEHEYQFYQVRIGNKYVKQNVVTETPFKFAHITRGDDDLLNIYGFNPRVLYMSKAVEGVQWLTGATFDLRDYDTLNDRDSTYIAIDETARKYVGSLRNSVSLGVSVFHDYTDAGIYEYYGQATTFGWRTILPWEIELETKFRFAINVYKEKDVLAPDDREDKQYYMSAGLSKMISQQLGITVQWQNTDNNSTFDLYEFNRNVFSLSAFCVF